MTFIAPLRGISKQNQRKVSKERKLLATVSHNAEPVEGVNQRYSHVGMPNKRNSSRSNDTSNRRRRTLHKIMEFPKASGAEAWDAGLTIIFELDDRRFAIGWNVNELNQKPAEVIPIRPKRQGKAGVSSERRV